MVRHCNGCAYKSDFSIFFSLTILVDPTIQMSARILVHPMLVDSKYIIIGGHEAISVKVPFIVRQATLLTSLRGGSGGESTGGENLESGWVGSGYTWPLSRGILVWVASPSIRLSGLSLLSWVKSSLSEVILESLFS